MDAVDSVLLPSWGEVEEPLFLCLLQWQARDESALLPRVPLESLVGFCHFGRDADPGAGVFIGQPGSPAWSVGQR